MPFLLICQNVVFQNTEYVFNSFFFVNMKNNIRDQFDGINRDRLGYILHSSSRIPHAYATLRENETTSGEI